MKYRPPQILDRCLSRQEKWPRNYAQDYLLAKTKEQKQAALYGCPQEWEGLVRDHVKIALDRQKIKQEIKPC